MPDPIHDLDHFDAPGLPVTPLPASEVRRRGDRMRRRNNALAAVGSIAAVAIIAVPLALGAHGAERAEPAPGPAGSPSPTPGAQVAWLQTIPGDVDLTALPADATFAFTARDGSVVDDLTLCGVPAFSTRSGDPVAPAVDTAGAVHGEAGTESSAARTLALYPSDEVAAKALAAIRHGVESCPVQQQPGGAPLVQEPVPADLATDESFVFTQQSRMDKDLLADLTVFQVARVGNALYLATDHTSAGGPQVVDAEVRRLATWSAPVLSDLCVFAADPCSSGGGTVVPPTTGEGAVSAIPADFPLDAGLPGGGVDGTVPSPELSSCERTLAKPDVAEIAHAQWRTPSEIRDRRLMTFSREADAQAYVESVAELYCTVDDLGDGATRVTEGFGGAPFGDFSAIAVGHTAVDGQVAPGLVLTQVVRVGRAVLLAQRIDEAFTWSGDVDQQSVQLKGVSKDELRTVVDAMCTFTETGC